MLVKKIEVLQAPYCIRLHLRMSLWVHGPGIEFPALPLIPHLYLIMPLTLLSEFMSTIPHTRDDVDSFL